MNTANYKRKSWIILMPSTESYIPRDFTDAQSNDKHFFEETLTPRDFNDAQSNDKTVVFSSTKLYRQENRWAKSRLNGVRKNAETDGRPLPKKEVVDRSENLLYALLKKEIKPKFINPSFEGGIIIEFEKNGVYYMAEIDNEDDIVFLIRNNEETKVFDLNPGNYLDQIIDHV